MTPKEKKKPKQRQTDSDSILTIQRYLTLLADVSHRANGTGTLATLSTTGSKTVQYVLTPWPPSTNRIWRGGRGQGHVYISPRYRNYKLECRPIIKAQNIQPYAENELVEFTLWLFPPRNFKFDPSNYIKGVEDMLEELGVVVDDTQLRLSKAIGGPKVKGGCAVIELKPFNPDDYLPIQLGLLSHYGLAPEAQKEKKPKKTKKLLSIQHEEERKDAPW